VSNQQRPLLSLLPGISLVTSPSIISALGATYLPAWPRKAREAVATGMFVIIYPELLIKNVDTLFKKININQLRYSSSKTLRP
jgi:hypothetical protein